MKKIYQSPKIEIVNINLSMMIAASQKNDYTGPPSPEWADDDEFLDPGRMESPRRNVWDDDLVE